MSIFERCPSYRESNKRSKERQGLTLGVRFTEVSVKRESTVTFFISPGAQHRKRITHNKYKKKPTCHKDKKKNVVLSGLKYST